MGRQWHKHVSFTPNVCCNVLAANNVGCSMSQFVSMVNTERSGTEAIRT